MADGYGLVYSNSTLPGMSGGPVINEDGKVIGVHGRGDTTNEESTPNPNVRVKTGFNLAIPIATYISWKGNVASPNTPVESPNTPIASSRKEKKRMIILSKGKENTRKGIIKGLCYTDRCILSLNEDYAYAYYNRGIARQKSGDDLGAVKDYSKALRINPNLPFEIVHLN